MVEFVLLVHVGEGGGRKVSGVRLRGSFWTTGRRRKRSGGGGEVHGNLF